jgi:hypothetical protein
MNDKKPEAPGSEESAWVGEPLRLTKAYDGLRAPGLLLDTVFLPGQDVHPAVQAAAEKVVAAQAKRDSLQELRDARVPERAQLARRLAEETASDAGRELTDFDSETELIKVRIELADQALGAAWETLAASKDAHREAWDQYLRAGLQDDAEALLGDVQRLQARLSRMIRRENLLAREGIEHRNAQTGPEWHAGNQRVERQQSIARIFAGAGLPNDEGHQHGLLDLPGEYAQLAEPPVPEPEPEIEPVPIPLQNQRRRVGLDPLTGQPVDPFVVSDG